MLTATVAYLATAVVFFAIDFVWLGTVATSTYREGIGHLMADKPNFAAAGVFYIFYVGGVVALVVWPALQADDWRHALLWGAVLGAMCYGTYDFTNLATLRDWPLWISVMDLVWGTILTAVSALAGFFITRLIVGTGVA